MATVRIETLDPRSSPLTLESQTMAPMKLPAHGRAGEDPFDSYTLTHLAHLLHVTRRRIRQMLQHGELPFVEVRGQIRVPRSAIELDNV